MAVEICDALRPLLLRNKGKNCTKGPVTENTTVKSKLIIQKNDTLKIPKKCDRYKTIHYVFMYYLCLCLTSISF